MSLTSPAHIQSDGQIACHGNRWGNHGTNLEETKAHINASFDRLQAATGLKNVPTGWFVGTASVHMKLGRAEVRQTSRVRPWLSRTGPQGAGRPPSLLLGRLQLRHSVLDS